MESAEPPEPSHLRTSRHEIAALIGIGFILFALSCWGLRRYPPIHSPTTAAAP